jgi:hypothetical protein
LVDDDTGAASVLDSGGDMQTLDFFGRHRILADGRKVNSDRIGTQKRIKILLEQIVISFFSVNAPLSL